MKYAVVSGNYKHVYSKPFTIGWISNLAATETSTKSHRLGSMLDNEWLSLFTRKQKKHNQMWPFEENEQKSLQIGEIVVSLQVIIL